MKTQIYVYTIFRVKFISSMVKQGFFRKHLTFWQIFWFFVVVVLVQRNDNIEANIFTKSEILCASCTLYIEHVRCNICYILSLGVRNFNVTSSLSHN